MFKSGGLFFPDGETHFIKYGDEVTNYQKPDRDAAYQYVKDWRRALDVGANVGIFARDFSLRFEEVVAFEPIPSTRECLALNVPSNVRIEPYAIIDEASELEMYRTGSSGGSFISNHRQIATPPVQIKADRFVQVETRTIDSFDFDAVDLIKLDIQGAEHLALLGARETILRHRPVVMIEEKAFSKEDAENMQKAAEILIAFGMTPKDRAQADRVYVFEQQL